MASVHSIWCMQACMHGRHIKRCWKLIMTFMPELVVVRTYNFFCACLVNASCSFVSFSFNSDTIPDSNTAGFEVKLATIKKKLFVAAAPPTDRPSHIWWSAIFNMLVFEDKNVFLLAPKLYYEECQCCFDRCSFNSILLCMYCTYENTRRWRDLRIFVYEMKRNYFSREQSKPKKYTISIMYFFLSSC